MKINELTANTKVPSLVGTITKLEKSEIVTTKNGEKKVQEGIIEDETGQVKINLWGDQADILKEGDTIIITNGWCKSFENEIQVATGFHGKLHKVPPKISDKK